MDLIQKASKLGYKHYMEFTIDELDKLQLNNSNKQIEYYFLQKWLRDREENMIIVIPMRAFHRNYNGWYYEVLTQLTKKDNPVLIISSDENFDTYEEALEKGLQEALKLI